MIDPIGSGPLPSPIEPHSSDVSELARAMHDQVTTLVQHLQQISEDPYIPASPAFLKGFAENCEHLNRAVQATLLIR